MMPNISNAFINGQQQCFLTNIVRNMSIANMTKTKRNIDDADRKAAKKLKHLWSDFKKKNPEISQEKAGARVGLSQAVFSQYLLCTIPIGVAATLKFAKLFDVHPHEIRDDLEVPAAQVTIFEAKSPEPALYDRIPPEAQDIARAWLSLPASRRQCFKEQLFLEAAVAQHFPWLKVGQPATDTYKQFEKQLEKAFSRIKSKPYARA